MSEPYRSPYTRVATVEKTVGLKGEVVACSADGLFSYLYPGLTVFLVPPSIKAPNTLVIEEVLEGQTADRVRFRGIDSLDDAKGLVGRTLLALRDDIDEEGSAGDLIGREVVCVDHGPIGKVVSLITTPANEVLDVFGPLGEVLVPVIDEVILSIPQDADEPIQVRLLAGLVDDEAEFVDPDPSADGYGTL